MADWDPAEMIGVNPKPLAQSLYEKIITNNVWSKSRSLLGYQDLSKNRLMIFVAGSPYINVSLSLASLLPKQLDKKISKKILNDQINYLSCNRNIHDKIEFEVAFSSIDFNFEKRSKIILKSLQKSEIKTLKNQLIDFTNKIVTLGIKSDYKTKFDSNLMFDPKNLDVSKFISTIKKKGTIPFAISARHAFISMAFLKSAKQNGVIKDSSFNDIMQSINTVASEVIENFHYIIKVK